MTISVHAIQTESGVPIFSRKKSPHENIEFTSIASLHGVDVFSNLRNISILKTNTHNETIVWKHFDCITLIGIGMSCSSGQLEALLTTVYDALIFHAGKGSLENIQSAEQFKREIRSSFAVIDLLIDSLMPNRNGKPTLNLNLIESMACSQALQLQQCLETYTKRLGGRWSSLVIQGRIAATSKDWTNLHPREARLLQIATVEDGAPLREKAIFLPQTSPYVAFRAITCKLLSDVYVVVICGSTPTLPQIDEIVMQCWESCTQTLKEAKSCYPKNFPFSMEFDPGVLGVWIVDIATQKCYISRVFDSSSNQKGNASSHRIDILRTFYLKAASELVPEISNTVQEKNDDVGLMTECYWCLDFHKCYAKKKDGVLCCVLFPPALPVHTMRMITSQTIAKFNIVLEQFNL